MSQQYKLIRCNINGKDVEKMVDVRASLTDMLRTDYHLTSVKKGCEVSLTRIRGWCPSPARPPGRAAICWCSRYESKKEKSP